MWLIFIQTNVRCHYKLATVSLMSNNYSFDEKVRYFSQAHLRRDWVDNEPSKNILFFWGSHDIIVDNSSIQISVVDFQIK